MPIRYKPEPGSTESRVVELLRFLPCGTALDAKALRQRLHITARGSLHIHLGTATKHGPLRTEKRHDGERLRTYWMDSRPSPFDSIPAGRTLKGQP